MMKATFKDIYTSWIENLKTSFSRKEPNQGNSFYLILVGFLALAIAYSVRAVLSLFMPIWEQDLGWSRSFVSSSAAVALVVMAILAPMAGRLVDQQGAKKVLISGLMIIAASCLVISSTSNEIIFFITFSFISALGLGIVSVSVVSSAVGQQFPKNAGLAIGVSTSGSTVGQFIVIPAMAILLTAISWRWSFVSLSLSCFILVLWIWKYLPDKRVIKEHSTEELKKSKPTLQADIIYILKKPAFHALFWSYAFCGYTTTGVIETHFLPYMNLCGFSIVDSATAFGLLSAINLAGVIFVGWLSDRMNRPLLLALIYFIRAGSFILLDYVGTNLNLEGIYFFAILFGLVDYSTLPVTASLVTSHIGLRVAGLAFGIISGGHRLGAALGAYVGGYLFDIYVQYDWLWWSSIWISVFAGVLLILMMREKKPLSY